MAAPGAINDSEWMLIALLARVRRATAPESPAVCACRTGAGTVSMASRDEVRGLLGDGQDYRTAAARLGIAPGAAYLIATGRPADGSDSRWFTDPGDLPPSPQRLLGPPSVNPVRHPVVEAWVRERARRELS
jgi:hypothetical protein